MPVEFTDTQKKHASKVAMVVLQHVKVGLPPDLAFATLLAAAGIVAAEMGATEEGIVGCEDVVLAAFKGHERGTMDREKGRKG